MRRYDGILICSDLDGTLVNTAGEISLENARAVAAFQENGGMFTISTGRLPSHLRQFFSRVVPNVAIISHNGACIYDFAAEAYRYRNPIRADTMPLFSYLQDTAREAISFVTMFTDTDKYSFSLTEAMDALHSIRPYKIVLVMDQEPHAISLQDTLRASAFQHTYCFSRSWPTGLEILDITATKGTAVLELKQLLGCVQTTICIGNYENDISMLRCADIGYAVDNAPAHVKRWADRLCASCDADAIAQVIAAL